ncbi:MAG TPA: ribosome small subunit-dependent GTPase A [bacterium]|jgi:ribosome biogenesis GTPase
MHELSALGFTPFFEAQLKDWSEDPLHPARVASEHRGSYEVWSHSGTGIAHLAGRLHKELTEDALPHAGDWVALKSAPEQDRIAIIEHVFSRRTALVRGAAGQDARGQVIAANVDLVFVVCGLDADYNARRIERYLSLIWASGAQPVVALNKTDVCDVIEARIAEIEARSPGVPVFATSAVQSGGIDEIRSRILPGMTAAFVGSSGAGKSTLINALVGEERMATRAVRADDSRGRHTTTRRQLVVLPGGGLLLDTPGMRELQLMDDEGIGAVFFDIEKIARDCRYRDCQHDNEPGCAVRTAIADGRISAERFEHFGKLKREAHAYAVRHDVHLRQKAEREWRILTNEGKANRRRKEGR